MRIPAALRIKFLKEAIKNGLKLLTYDIETSHMLVRTFYIGNKVSIFHKQIKKPSQVISIQYKWATDKKAKYLEWDSLGNNEFDDSSMIEEFAHNVLSKADIVITQNGDRFDFITLNERAKALKLDILDQKPSIDILKLSRKSFRAASHKLDFRSQQQGLGGKIRMEDDDWVDIEERGVPATKKMIPYGLKDVEDTEKVMWNELPYYKDLPVAVEKVILSFLEKPEKIKHVGVQCVKCKSTNTQKHGTHKNLKGLMQRHQCQDCGKWFMEKIKC
jgi:hypothetical protein